MKRYFYLLIVLVLPFYIQAQNISGNYSDITGDQDVLNTNVYTGAGMYNGTGLSAGTTFPVKPVAVNVQTGASFGSMGYGGNYFQSYLSPSLSMPLNKKLSVSAGLTYSHTTFNNMPMLRSNGEFRNYSGAMNTLTLYTSGAYRVNDRLTYTGSAYKTINPSFNARLNPETLQMEAKGVSFGVDYKLGENTHIGAEIRYQQGNGNLYNPYNIYNSPFRNNNF